MKWTLLTLVMMTAAFSAWLASAQQATDEGHSYWMKKKLEFAEHILAGMATADFEKISKSATSMKNLNQIEESGSPQERGRISHAIAHLSLRQQRACSPGREKEHRRRRAGVLAIDPELRQLPQAVARQQRLSSVSRGDGEP